MNNIYKTNLKFILSEMFKCFSYSKSGMADAWVERIISSRFEIRDVRDASVRCIETFDKCPSYAEFKSIIINESGELDVSEKLDAAHQKEYVREMAVYYAQRAEIVKIIGEEGLDNFFRKMYIPRVFPKLSTDAKKHGITLKTFERLAVIDLHRARLKPEKAVQIGLEKTQQKA